jgi:hypothetical protein
LFWGVELAGMIIYNGENYIMKDAVNIKKTIGIAQGKTNKLNYIIQT